MRTPAVLFAKQLERPWKAAEAQAIKPHGVTWPSSQQGNSNLPRVGVRPRSGALSCRNRTGSRGSNRRMRNSASASSGLSSGRRRPSTVPCPSSSGLTRQRAEGNTPSYPLPVDPTWKGSDCVRLDETGIRIRGRLSKPEQNIAALQGYGYRPGSSGGEGNRHAGLGNNQPVQAFADATFTSAVSSSSFFATSSITTTGAAGDVGGGEDVGRIHKASRLVGPPSGNRNNGQEEEDSYNNKSNVSLGSMDDVGLSVGSGTGTAVKRPNSAGVSATRDASIHPLVLKGDNVIRPRTAGSSSLGRAVYPRSTSREGRLNEHGRAPTSSRPGPAKGGCSVTSWTGETPDTGSLLECRTSVSVVLPTLEEGNDTGEMR